MRSYLLNTIVVLVTLLCMAVLGEITVRVLQHYEYVTSYGKPPTKQRVETKNRVKNSYNIKYVKSENPKLFVEYDPADPRVNKLGMRGPVPALSKAKNVYRIAVIGDSVAFGFGLPDTDSFPRQLERLLNQHSIESGTSHSKTFEILNFAVSGYGLEANSEVYRTKVRAFKPDLVILAYVLNDPLSNKASFKAIGDTMIQAQKLHSVGKVSQLAAWLLDTYRQASDSYISTKKFNEMYFKPEYKQVIDDNLALLHTEIMSDGVTLVAFVFPYFHDLSNYPLKHVHAVIDASLQHAGISHHDLLDEYRSHDGLTLRLEPNDYTHPNAEGQRIAAEAIENYLKKQKLL